MRLYGEDTRFIPAGLATVTTRARLRREVVTTTRMFGGVKYGISRTFRVILDLIFVYFFMRFRTRRATSSVGIGLGLGALGVLILSYLGLLKLFSGTSIGTRPMFFGGFFFVIAGIQMVTTGVLAELLTQVVTSRSGQSQAYVARTVKPWMTARAGGTGDNNGASPMPGFHPPAAPRRQPSQPSDSCAPPGGPATAIWGALFDVDEARFRKPPGRCFRRDFLFTYLSSAPASDKTYSVVLAAVGQFI